MASASAVEWTATVAMPSSFAARRMRRAISPRLAMKSYRTCRALLDDEEGFAVFNRSSVFDIDGGHRAGAGATISLKVFMASTSRTFSPAWTLEPTSTKSFASGEGLR